MPPGSRGSPSMVQPRPSGAAAVQARRYPSVCAAVAVGAATAATPPATISARPRLFGMHSTGSSKRKRVISRENDLAARGLLVELANGQNPVECVDEVVLLQAKHVHRR